MMLTRPLSSLSLLLAASISAQLLAYATSLSVEQSFGGAWSHAGSINGLPPSKGLPSSSAVFVRQDLSTAEKQQLQLAAAQNGLYTLKLNLGGPDQYVVTSVRAACLLQAQDEQLRVHVDEEGRILGAQYEVVPSECTGTPSEDALQRRLAATVPVKLQSPKPGPIVVFTGGEDMLSAQRGKKAPQVKPPPQAQQEGQAGGEGGEQAANGKPRSVPKEEQTWWQRNWVYLAILFGLGLQVLKAQLEPQVQEIQRQEAAQRRGAGAGGAGAAGGAGGTGAGRGQVARRRG